MSKKKLSKSYRLLVVAHPDDETLFFAGALFNLRDRPWHVICVTNGNADGQGVTRAKQFQQACRKLNVERAEQLEFEDIYEKRLNIKDLQSRLELLPEPREVYTHGIVGEYGHPHHQDVSFAVHTVFAKKVKVWSPAYNCRADKVIPLNEAQYKAKSLIYADIYQGETLRFAGFLPHRNVDEYVQLEMSELKEIYSSILESRAPVKSKLRKYRWFYAFLADKNTRPNKRPF